MILDFETEKWIRMKSPKGLKTEGFNGCMSPVEDCKNPSSYGALCVLCNLCGRFEEDKEDDNAGDT